MIVFAPSATCLTLAYRGYPYVVLMADRPVCYLQVVYLLVLLIAFGHPWILI